MSSDTVFPIHVTEPRSGVIHGFSDDRTLCGEWCAHWPIIVGGTWDCPRCQVAWDEARMAD